MAESSLTFVLTKLTEIIQSEELLLRKIREEAEYITDELGLMKAFLRAADAIEESEPELQTLVRKLRDLSYDIEDVIDEFKLRLPRDHEYGCYTSVERIAQNIMTLKTRHVIASKILSIKSRVKEVLEQHRRYMLKNDIMRPGPSSNSTMQLSRRGDALLLEEADLVGIERPKRQLISKLLDNEPARAVISVVGTGGIGKSTLVKQVYDDPDVKKNFEFRAWITVSQTYNIEELLKDMIQQLYCTLGKADPPGLDSMDIYKLRAMICQFLERRRYLIVLDDVWEIDAWDAFGFALPNNNGGRVLLTTRNGEVAPVSCIPFPDSIHHRDYLSPEESWSLFCRKTFHSKSCPPHLELISKRILARCGGLPLAIVAISGLLATKDQGKVDEWEMVARSLSTRLEYEDRLRSMKKILSLSYNALPYYLKSCLLYFSIFPVGTPIEHMKLLRLWIAEGFVEEKQGMTLEEISEHYLKELIKRNLVEVAEATSDGRVKTCRIHDVLQEILLLKAKEQGFVTIVEKDNMVWPKGARRVSIQDVMPGRQQRRIASRVRSLLVFWGVDSLSEAPLLNSSFTHLKLLNVLDFEGVPLKQFPDEVVNLSLLKYINLRYTKVESIPSSIGKLQNLETLDLKHALVTKLPVEILTLKKLRHILVYRYEMESDDRNHTKYGFNTPAQIGELLSMQNLCFIEANSSIVKGIGRLNHLRRLGIVELRKEDGKVLCSSIDKLVSLVALSVISRKQSEIIDLEHLQSPPPFLQLVYLTGRLEKLPTWMSKLDSLVKVVLKRSQLSDDPLVSLQHLPNLMHIELLQVYGGEELRFKRGGFPSLRVLGLMKLDKLKRIYVHGGAMPRLHMLVVQCCNLLQKVPYGIKFLREVKQLQFLDMPHDFIKRLYPNGGQDYSRVRNVPDVYCTFQVNGTDDVYQVGRCGMGGYRFKE